VNNLIQLTNSIIKYKEFNNCPILKLGYLHSLEWLDFFKSRNLLNLDIFLKNNKKLFIPTICFDLADETTFVSIEKNILNALNNFHNKNDNKNKNIFFEKDYHKTNFNIVNFLNGNINNNSICSNSAGDPFIQIWTLNKKITENICWVEKNISKTYESNFKKITLNERIEFLKKNNYDIKNKNLIFLLFIPSFALENYENFKKNILLDAVKWPKFKSHLGSYTCFSDPVFHLIANFNNINNIGFQHGGGPLAAVLEVKNEILAYNEFYFQTPFKKRLHNCRGDKSFNSLFTIESTKIIKYIISKKFRIFGFKEMILKPSKKILYKLAQNTLRFIYIDKNILPLFLFSEQRDSLPKNINFINEIKWDFYIKFHPMDEILCKEYLISKKQLFKPYPYKGRIEENLWRWNKSFIIVNSYSITTLLFLFEGSTPFLICLNDIDMDLCLNNLNIEALNTFNIFKENNIIISQKFLKNLNIDEVYTLSYNAMKYCRLNFSSNSSLKKSNIFNQ
jgi:hypothetical protein